MIIKSFIHPCMDNCGSGSLSPLLITFTQLEKRKTEAKPVFVNTQF